MSLSVSKPKYIVVTTNPPPLLPGGAQDTQVLTNVQGVNTWTYPQYNYKGSNLFPTNSVNDTSITLADGPGIRQGGGALSPNGSVYFGPFGAWSSLNNITRAMKVNPYSNTVSYVDISVNGNYGYRGMACANNGKIFALPGSVDTSNILVIDTLNNDTVSYISGLNIDVSSYRGFVNFNNNIYTVPFNADNILSINPVTNTATVDISGINTTTYPLLGSNLGKFSGGVVGTDGNIYFIPQNASRVMRYNPISKTLLLSNTPDASGYSSGALSSNSRIYMSPSNALNIAYIDISNYSLANLAVNRSITNFFDASGSSTDISALGLGGSMRFIGTILGPNGSIYCIPDNSSRILVVDTSNNTARQIYPTNNQNLTSTFGGAVLAPNGQIYVCPNQSNSIPIIKTGLPSQQGWMYAPSFNKSP